MLTFVIIMLTCVGIGVASMMMGAILPAIIFLAIGLGMYFVPCCFGWTVHDRKKQDDYDNKWGSNAYWDDWEERNK